MNDPNSYGGAPTSWSKPEDLVGTTLADRYKVQSLLGDGGMGSVFAAEHVTLRKRVAIKVLHPELCRDQTQVDRFLQEARAASMIGHENIVDIVDFGPVPGGSVFFAMEFLEGEDLSDLLRREGRLKWPRARGLMLQIVRALGAAHRKGIIHRDLKPANCFLVKRSDGRDFVKLLDFGIAKVNDPDTGDGGGLTRTGAVFGTAKYMAPEQACGEPADQRTDIYAAAICLYEFLTGSVPFDGDNFMRVLSRHLTEPLTLPSTMAPDAQISPAVEAAVVKALSKKREDRYQSMAEFEQALLAIGLDGNLAMEAAYDGPPIGGTQPAHAPAMDAPGSTVWLSNVAQASQGPASQPPEGRGGTLLLDGEDAQAALAGLERGTAKLGGPHAFAGQQGGPTPPRTVMGGAPAGTAMMDGMGQAMLPTGGGPGAAVTRNPGGPAPHPSTTPPSPETRPPTFSPDTRGDYTQFAEPKRSKAGFVALLLGGAVFAVGGGGLAAWALLGSPDDDKDKTELPASPEVAKADADAKPSGPLVPEAPEKPEEPEIPQTPEQPEADPEPESPPEQPEADPEPEQPQNTPRRPTPRRPRPTPSVKDALTDKDISKGLAKADKAVQACKAKGGLPGMRVTVDVTINSLGKVSRATAQSPHATSPLGKCVASAVQSRAQFPKSKQPLVFKKKTYKF